MQCPNCNNVVPDTANVCGHCGQRLKIAAPAMIVCPNCKAQNHPDVRFCEKCGAALTGSAAPMQAATPTMPPAPQLRKKGAANWFWGGAASLGILALGMFAWYMFFQASWPWSPRIVIEPVSQFPPTSGLQQLADGYTDLTKPGTGTWEVKVSADKDVIVILGWCAKTADIFSQNMQIIHWSLRADGRDVPLSMLYASTGTLPDGRKCVSYTGMVWEWPKGKHKIITTMHLDQSLNDGWSDYPAGYYTDIYNVTVTP